MSRVSDPALDALSTRCQRHRFWMRSMGHGAGPTSVTASFIFAILSDSQSAASCAHAATASSSSPLTTTFASRRVGGYGGLSRPGNSSATKRR